MPTRARGPRDQPSMLAVAPARPNVQDFADFLKKILRTR
jgi:hypothetical protein